MYVLTEVQALNIMFLSVNSIGNAVYY